MTTTNTTAIPPIAYGTGTSWATASTAPPDTKLISAITTALHSGFRHLDGAESYNNERELGIAVTNSGIARTEIFLTTKLWPTVSDPSGAFSRSLQRLQTEYVDLYLLHCPFFTAATHGTDVPTVWRALESIHASGNARNIGVSNFNAAQIRELLGYAKVRPAVNQVEFHPYCCDTELLEVCAAEGITVAAYSPLAPVVRFKGGPLDEVVERVAGRCGKTVEQVLMKWARQMGCVVVTTTSKEERMRAFLEVEGEWSLTDEEVEEILSVGKTHHRRVFWRKQYGEADA